MQISLQPKGRTVPDLRILIADDDMDDSDLLRLAFEKAGVAAHLNFVRHGQAVIDYLEGRGPYQDRELYPLPSLLLLDLKMPSVDGFQVLEWRRENKAFIHIPVLVFSGSDQPVDINRAYELGAERYLVKPQKITDLMQMVRGIEKFWSRQSVAKEHLKC